jgi:signal transduction histidine kinase
LRDYLAEILAETERVAGIVRSLLAFARDERQHYSPARIVDIVDGTLTLIRTVMRRDQITLDVTIPDGLPIVCCRSQQVQQVLMNLVTNARDALNERYPGYDARKIIRVTAGASEREDGTWVRLTVEDRGNGIPPDIRARIFEPFFTTKPQGKGTGLGLSISHGIVRDHNGDLHVETELGQYTRFHVDLPAEPLPSASATTAEAPLQAPVASALPGGAVDAVAVPGPKARG